MKNEKNIEVRTYDWKLAAMQTKKIYKKFIALIDKSETKIVTPEDMKKLFSSIDFLIDIIHLMDPVEDPEDRDIELINICRPTQAGKEG